MTDPPAAIQQPALNETLKPLFEEVNVVKMHLFATVEEAPNAEKYPYTGKPITGDALKLLDASLQTSPVGGVFGCYHTENGDFYVLRVPGKYISGDLALAKWDAASNSLKKVADLAYLNCDEGYCNQQDSWLTDLDDSRTLELITRSRSTDEKGKVDEENFTVMTEDGKGGFIKADEKLTSLAIQANYVLNK